jgi:hypothetical protein
MLATVCGCKNFFTIRTRFQWVDYLQKTMAAPAKNLTRIGEQTFQKMDKINAEVFTLTYGRYLSKTRP